MILQEDYSSKQVHFTYKQQADYSSLCQGDVLEVTEDLKGILEKVHPYFLNEQYRYFMVLTQSCDLVRRDGVSCKTPYITLAAIRSFDDFFEKTMLSLKYAEKVSDYLLMDSKYKDRVYQLVERIYNNTEPDYFFLYREEKLGFPESMIASLKVSIALKSSLHYDACLSAKKLELSDEFKAKLGWLVGNIYSRVGTTDWEGQMTARERRTMLNEVLNSRCAIGANVQINKLKSALLEHTVSFSSLDEVEKYISDIKIETRYEKAIKELESIILGSKDDIQLATKERLINRIKSKQTLKGILS